jgi:hypothetical protein
MRLLGQLIGAAVLAWATWFSLERIAQAKNETAVGGAVFSLAGREGAEGQAFESLCARVDAFGERPFADRLRALRDAGDIWVAPALGPDRWAVFVDSLHLVRRVYIRQKALLDPVGHLQQAGPISAPAAYQEVYGTVSLAGALRHELAHREGVLQEDPAYEQEIAWYEGLRRSPVFQARSGDDRRLWEWATDSAIQSARAARARAE